jgi:hypothetical protein
MARQVICPRLHRMKGWRGHHVQPVYFTEIVDGFMRCTIIEHGVCKSSNRSEIE